METTIFYIFAIVILIFSVLAVTSRRILRAAVYFLFVLLAVAGLFFLLSFNFLAAVQLTVYAGGIIVLFIFSIMLTSQVNDKLEPIAAKKIIFSLLAAIAGAVVCISAIMTYRFSEPKNIEVDAGMKTIGKNLLSYGENGYALPFEVISLLLLASLIGAIMIAKRDNT